MGKKNKRSSVADENETVPTGEQTAEPVKPAKEKRNKQKSRENENSKETNGNGAEEQQEEEQLITFQKPSKKRSAEQDGIKLKKKKAAQSVEDKEQETDEKVKKKRSAEEQQDDTEAVPPKIPKTDKSNLIVAGTTIDQVKGVKLKTKKTKKELRREKYVAMLEEQSKKSRVKERQEIRQYLELWSKSREQWKFNKLKQILLQDRVFSEEDIDGELWPIAVEYLSGTKGAGKELMVNKAKSIIREVDEAVDKTEEANGKYARARELLQSLG